VLLRAPARRPLSDVAVPQRPTCTKRTCMLALSAWCDGGRGRSSTSASSSRERLEVHIQLRLLGLCLGPNAYARPSTTRPPEPPARLPREWGAQSRTNSLVAGNDPQEQVTHALVTRL
jgi:hypothetical protein